MRPRHSTLTPQELEIMKLVWARETATVRDIYETLLEHRKIAYTTVMTMMKILETKGYLKKRRHDRAFIYRPAHPKSQVIDGMIREFIDRVFNG
jgi:predicted transcriptional regulator